MSLTTLANLKLALGVNSTTEDDYLTLIQAGVEAALERMTNRVFATSTDTEYYNGNNTDTLILNHTPVTQVNAVYVDRTGRWGQNASAFGTDMLLDAAEYYLAKDGPGQTYSESGKLIRANSIWEGYRVRQLGLLTPRDVPGQGNIKVAYVGGYATIPNDVQMAVWESVGALRQSKKFGYVGFIQSEGLSSSSYSLGPYGEFLMSRIGSVAQVVATYMKPVI